MKNNVSALQSKGSLDEDQKNVTLKINLVMYDAQADKNKNGSLLPLPLNDGVTNTSDLTRQVVNLTQKQSKDPSALDLSNMTNSPK